MEGEISRNTEWTMFDDTNLKSMGTWLDILEHCYQTRIYPTVILYEKLDPNENEPVVLQQKLQAFDIAKLFRDSKRQDMQFDDFYSGQFS